MFLKVLLESVLPIRLPVKPIDDIGIVPPCPARTNLSSLFLESPIKGVPKDLLKKEIIDGKSISLCFPKYKIYSSAIVGGVLPISVGLALSFKRKRSMNKVYCFMGDMTSETGIAHETIKFSISKKLPIHFIIEDNAKSVCTDTRKTWSLKKLSYEKKNNKFITFYKYKLKYPHAGAGKRVQF